MSEMSEMSECQNFYLFLQIFYFSPGILIVW